MMGQGANNQSAGSQPFTSFAQPQQPQGFMGAIQGVGNAYSAFAQPQQVPSYASSYAQQPPASYPQASINQMPQPQQPAPQQPAPQTGGFSAWDPNTHYTQGMQASYGGQNYVSLGDTPNGQTGAGGGTWNENSRPDITGQLWKEVPSQQPQQAQPQAQAQPQRVPTQPMGPSFAGAAPQAWQYTGMKRGGIVDLPRRRK